MSYKKVRWCTSTKESIVQDLAITEKADDMSEVKGQERKLTNVYTVNANNKILLRIIRVLLGLLVHPSLLLKAVCLEKFENISRR